MSPILVRCLPFGLYIALLALEGLLPTLGLSDVRWLYPVKVTLVAVTLAALWKHYTELKGTWPGLRDVALSLLVGLVIFVLWINLNEGWMRLGEQGAGYNPSSSDGQVGWMLVAFRIAGAALVVPLMEELFWRSFLQRWVQEQRFLALDPAKIGLKALLIASVLFATAHTQWLAAVIAGLAYGWLYIRTRTLWAPIIAHALTNGLLGFYVVTTESWYFW